MKFGMYLALAALAHRLVGTEPVAAFLLTEDAFAVLCLVIFFGAIGLQRHYKLKKLARQDEAVYATS